MNPAFCDCGVPIETSRQRQRFLYGVGEAQVELSAEVTVYTCPKCGDAYTDGEGEEARDEAVRIYKGGK